jgi:hypothetical protein
VSRHKTCSTCGHDKSWHLNRTCSLPCCPACHEPNYEPIQLLPGQVVYNDPDGLLQAQKEEQPKKTAPRKRKLDSLSEWPGFQAVKR